MATIMKDAWLFKLAAIFAGKAKDDKDETRWLDDMRTRVFRAGLLPALSYLRSRKAAPKLEQALWKVIQHEIGDHLSELKALRDRPAMLRSATAAAFQFMAYAKRCTGASYTMEDDQEDKKPEASSISGDDLAKESITHPSLSLNKFTVAEKQEKQRAVLDRFCGLHCDAKRFDEERKRYEQALRAVGASTWQCETTGPLALHLAASTAIENAGLCLHPLLGFAYLPGTGLKGLARSYAETIWLAAQPEDQRVQAWQHIESVFGWSPGSDEINAGSDGKPTPKPWKPQAVPERAKSDSAAAGSVVFHDAWPAQKPPKPHVDITNNHHGDYYNGKDAPGDWEQPNPVYFPVIGPRESFSFALSKRSPAISDDNLARAKEWLIGGLLHLGFGAKTAAGYGRFGLDPGQEETLKKQLDETAAKSTVFHSRTYRLRILTPAFLGDANHQLDDPAFRPATLKGLLRFWWRAMHGDYSVEKLTHQESLVFGSIEGGQGLHVSVSQVRRPTLNQGTDMGAAGSALGYLGYGPIAYDKSQKLNVTQQVAIDKMALYEVTLAHRSSDMLDEACKALWLLGALGGVGSRSRRGWGSVLIETPIEELPDLANQPDAQSLYNALMDGLDTICKPEDRKKAEDLNWTALGADMRVQMAQSEEKDSLDALKDIGARLQGFRSRLGQNRNGDGVGPDYQRSKALLQGDQAARKRTDLPLRAAFGMPYQQQYRSLGNKTVQYLPSMSGSPNAKEEEGRRASPLFIRVYKINASQGSQYAWGTIYLPAQFLPQTASVIGKGDKNTPLRVTLSAPDSLGGIVYQGKHFSEVESGGERVTDARYSPIQEFLDGIASSAITERKTIPQSPKARSSEAAGKAASESVLLEGKVTGKPNKRTATVELLDGRVLKEVKSAKSCEPGDAIWVKEDPPGSDMWIFAERIQGDA